MVVGQQNRKVIFIIQARMDSTRFPSKVLTSIPLADEKPILKWITDSLKKSKYFQKIYIATSTNELDNELESFSKKEKIFLYRGSENNVLSRFVNIIKREKPIDVIARLTADNPLIDINKLDETICKHINSDAHYTYTTGLPLGMNFEIINSNCLLNSANLNLSHSDKEHVTLFIKNSNDYKKQKISFSNVFNSIRATIDYPSDYAFVSTYIEYVKKNSISISSESIQDFVKIYPWTLKINNQNFQKKEFLTIEDEIQEVLPILKRLEFDKLYKFLKDKDLKNSN